MNRGRAWVALRCYNPTMIKWEYARLVQRRVRNKKDPAKPGWVNSSIIYPEPKAEEALAKVDGWRGNGVDLAVSERPHPAWSRGLGTCANRESYNSAWTSSSGGDRLKGTCAHSG